MKLALPCVFIGPPPPFLIRLILLELRQMPRVMAVGRWTLYVVIYVVAFTVLWNLFLGLRGPNGRDDD